MVLTYGVYAHSSGLPLNGVLTLDGQNNPASVFIFKAGSTLITGPNSRVALINGANPCNVFWQVGLSLCKCQVTQTMRAGTIEELVPATQDQP